MSWDSIGSVDTGQIPGDEAWIEFCQDLAIRYIRYSCGAPPPGVTLGTFSQDHELGSYPSIGVWTDFGDDDGFVVKCQDALDVFNRAIEWHDLKEFSTSEPTADEEEVEEPEDVNKTPNGQHFQNALNLEHVFQCSLCPNEAGQIRLHDRGDFYELYRKSFVSVQQTAIDQDKAAIILEAFSTGSIREIYEIRQETACFYCPKCDAIYCGDHWTRWDVFDDDGWHDSIRGKCPKGHERMLED